jgi:hypothetical protein
MRINNAHLSTAPLARTTSLKHVASRYDAAADRIPPVEVVAHMPDSAALARPPLAVLAITLTVALTTALGIMLASFPGRALADEGMWTYDHFPAAQMRAKYGWAPDAAWLEHARLASIRLAQGCSASLVSPDGLVMTNHHCVRECLAGLADATHDYPATGFYAATAAQERRCPDLEANQLIDITDVSAQVQAATAGRSGQAFHDALRAVEARLTRACATAADLRCQVVMLYQGGVYDLYQYRRYQDIRVVFAPEERAAFFGGDLDNFTFPRFDLDVAFIRIYTHGAPLHTTDYLRFATRGVRAGDIALTSGNPGGTDRADTVAQVRFQRDVAQPFVLQSFSELRGLLTQFSTAGAQRAQAASTLLFSVQNTLKLYKGRQLALVQGTVLADKTHAEQALQARVAADPRLAAGTAAAWAAIAAAVAHERDLYVRNELLERLVPYFSPLLAQAVALNRYAAESLKPDGQRLEEYTDANFPALKQQIDSPAPLHRALEKAVLTWWLGTIRADLGSSDPDVRTLLGSDSPQRVAAAVVDGTRLTDAALRARLLAGGAAAINADHDPLLQFARRLDRPARAVRADYEDHVQAPITRNSALIAQARFALDGRNDYPDATFTLRLSYGTVAGYRDHGREVAPVTDFAGAYAHATGQDPFRLPDSWLRARPAVDPRVTLDFTSTNDVVGGNSGSPVIGRDGRVIGLIFDGNLQSLGGDFGYDGSVNRAIAVDVTGITAALEHIYHADRLVHELSP